MKILKFKRKQTLQKKNQNENERSEALLSIKCHIKRVRDYIRKLDEQAYTLKVISIDPIHHKLETMENHKVRYFKIFITRTETNLENLVITISEMEEHIQYVAMQRLFCLACTVMIL